jgi:hypothetical protein
MRLRGARRIEFSNMPMAARESAVVKTDVNVTLAVRKALRRYLKLEPAVWPSVQRGCQ